MVCIARDQVIARHSANVAFFFRFSFFFLRFLAFCGRAGPPWLHSGVPVACRSRDATRRDASSRTEGRRVASRPAAVRALLQVADPSARPARPASRLYTERPSLLRSPREKIDSSKWSLPSPASPRRAAPRPARVVFSRRASYPRDAASAGPTGYAAPRGSNPAASPRRLPPRRVSRFLF